MRLPRLLCFHPALLVMLLMASSKAVLSDEPATTSGELNSNELKTDVDEPSIALPEYEQKRNPFRNVSQGVRKESTDPLVILSQEAVDTTARRMLSTQQHTPWQMMHALLGLRHDFQLLDGDQTVSGLDWIQQGQIFDNEYWFEKTSTGGRAHPYSRPYAFEGHANQSLAILSMCGVSLDQEFGTADGSVTIREMLEHAKMTLDLKKDEPTWTLWALSRYLPCDARWRNSDGEVWSIERLVQEQTARPMQGAPCGGTHSLFALAHARNVYLRQGKPLRGVWLQAEYKIRKYIDTARQQQNSNGTLSSNYFRGRQYDPDFNKRMASAGHVLEFLMIALPQEELRALWVRRAIEATANDLMRNRKAYVKCSPLYHSVNALNIYLDRVNPRSAPDVASADENPRTAMLTPRRISDAQGGLKRVPARGISKSRDLPAETEGSAIDNAVADTEVPKAVEAPNTPLSLPVVAADPEPASEIVSVPALVRNNMNAAISRDSEKWVSTPPERRRDIEVPEENNNVKIAEAPVQAIPTTNVTDAVADDSEVMELRSIPPEAIVTQPTEAIEEKTAAATAAAATVEAPKTEETDDSSTPAIETDTPVTTPEPTGTESTEFQATEQDQAVEQDAVIQSSVPVKSVSLPKLVEADSEEQESTVRMESIEAFMNPDLDAKTWVQKLEAPGREVAAEKHAIAVAAGITPGQSVADVGAGTGLFLKLFSEAVGSRGQVFAVDISPRLVEHLDAHVTAEKLGNVSVVRNDSRSLQLMTTRIHKAFVCDTYHQFEYPQEMLASIFKALYPGGELILVDYDRIPGESREDVLEVVRADKKTFREEIEAAGFEFIEEVPIPEMREHYLLRFRRPQSD